MGDFAFDQRSFNRWVKNNFSEDGTPRFPNPDVENIGKDVMRRERSIPPRHLPSLLRKVMPVVCAVDGQPFELPEDLVKKKTEIFGAEVRFYCNSHMERRKV